MKIRAIIVESFKKLLNIEPRNPYLDYIIVILKTNCNVSINKQSINFRYVKEEKNCFTDTGWMGNRKEQII